MDEFSPEERAGLDAWRPLEPPADFRERVLANRPSVSRASGWLGSAAGALAAAAAFAFAAWFGGGGGSGGSGGPREGEFHSSARATLKMGKRATVVSEADTELRWKVSDRGDAKVEQSSGNAFYRVEPGGAFDVHTPAGNVSVSGTCFRVEVLPMGSWKAGITGAAVSAAAIAAVVVTVYEGRVVTASPGGEAAVGAGQAVRMDGEHAPSLIGGGGALGAAAPEKGARAGGERPTSSAESGSALPAELVYPAYLEAKQEAQKLRSENEALKKELAAAKSTGAKGREYKTFDLDKDELSRMADRCELRWDMQPLRPEANHIDPADAQKLGLTPEEQRDVDGVLKADRDRVAGGLRAIYVEVTGDNSAGSLAAMSMFEEIVDKAPPGELQRVFQKLARERAGLEATPGDTKSASAWERLFRLMNGSGDALEASLAGKIGPDLAHQYRALHDGFGSKTRSSSGCPSTP